MKKERKLDKIYAEFETKYKDMPQEEMGKLVETTEKELASKKELLGKLNKNAPKDMVEKLEGEVKSLEAKVNNLEGYSKYKDQINSIKKVKDSLASKLEDKNQLKTEATNLIEAAKADLEVINERLSDEEYLQGLTNNEYNQLFIDKEEKEKIIEEQEKVLANAEKSILEIEGKIGRCDLAWKTLFTNKDWDEIQKRAVNDKRFTRTVTKNDLAIKTAPEEEKEESKEREEKEEKEEGRLSRAKNATLNFIGLERVEKVKDTLETLTDTMGNLKEEMDSLPPAKVTRWDKIKAFFRRAKDKFFAKKIKAEEIETKENKTEVNTERDEFIEALRKYADKEYGQAKQSELDEKYKQAHKAKDKKAENER